MVPLTSAQVEALEAIRGLWPKADILLVGALALGCHIDLSYRHTSDMDLAISIDVDRLCEISERLHGWKQHPKREHRFRSPSGEIVDVLPASPALLAQGFVEWPSGVRMGLEGFDLAFESSVLLPLSDSLHLRVPSAPAIALLKMRSWVDRPYDRMKDLQDLGHLFRRYVDDDDDRRWADEVMRLSLEFDEVSPYLLGLDLGHATRPRHARHVEEFLNRLAPEQFTSLGPWFDVEDTKVAIAAFRRGFTAEAG